VVGQAAEQIIAGVVRKRLALGLEISVAVRARSSDAASLMTSPSPS
jgi:hypothetical protein